MSRPSERRLTPGERVACPFCDSEDTELIAPFGSQLLTSQHRCRACRTYFEAVRDGFADDATTPGGA